MFRRARILRTTAPIETQAWRVENKHIFSVFGISVGTFGFLWGTFTARVNKDKAELVARAEQNRAELKADLKELAARAEQNKVELKADISALSAEIRAALSAMSVSKGAMDAHAQFYRDAKGRPSVGGLD